MKALVFSAKVLTIGALANACAPEPVPPRAAAASPPVRAKAPPRKPEWQQSFDVERKECASTLDADDSGAYFVARGLPDGVLEWTHVGLRGEATTRLRLPLSDDARILATRALAGKFTILALGSKLELLTLGPNGDVERAELWPSYDVTTGSIHASKA